MTKGEWMTPEEYIAKLEEEVEQRKEYQQRSQSADGEQIERLLWEKYKLEEENKKLKEKVASLEWEIKWLNYTIEKLKEENQTLELWLDRKEKLNEGYRKELEKLKSTYVYDAKQVRDIC